MSESEYFKIEIDVGIARCSMDGPNFNAMGDKMIFPMMEGIRSVLDDPDVRVIVMRGEGGNFSAGADLTIMGDKMDPAFLKENMRKMGQLIYELHEGPKPVIAEVDGWSVGGGFGLAMASDITYVTERARFFLSWVRLAIVPDFGASYFLTRRVGLAMAKELALVGKTIDAEEALRIELVNRIVPHEEISEEVMKLAGKLARRSPNIMALTKRFLNTGHQVDLQTFLDMEAYVQSIVILAPEHKEAVEKFLEKSGGKE